MLGWIPLNSGLLPAHAALLGVSQTNIPSPVPCPNPESVGQVHHPVPHQRPVDGVDARDVTGAGMGVDEGQISGERLLCFCNDGLKRCPLAPPLLMKMRDTDHGHSPPRTHGRRSGQFCGKFQSSTPLFLVFFRLMYRQHGNFISVH